MTEQAFINYNELARSYDIARMHQGILPAGRYAGFDAIQLVSTGFDHLEIEFTHTISGFTGISDSNVTAANKAKIVTPEGVVIEYAVVDSLNVDFETTGQPRIDVVVIDHDWESVAGGQQSAISVIKGTPAATPVAPGLTNPTTQTKIGEIYLLANADQINEYTYTKAPTPLPGNEATMAFLELITALENNKIDKVNATLALGTPYIGGPNTGVLSPEWIAPSNQTMCFRDENGYVTFAGRMQFNRQPSVGVTSTSKILMFELDASLKPNRPNNTTLVFPVYNETTRVECYMEISTAGDISFVPTTNSALVSKISTGDWINFSLNWWKV